MLKLFNKESKTIAGAALIIGASAILSRILGLIRDRLLVGGFGVGDELDAYYASFQIPNVLFALLVLGTLSVAFIPVFTEYLAKDKDKEAWHMANAILTVVMTAMGVLCFVLILGAPWLVRVIAPGFEGEKLALTVKLTRIMMLSPLFFAVSAVFSSILNSFKQFMAVSIAPLLYNGSLIFGILFLSEPFGIAGVAYGAILGAVLHLLIQVPSASALGMRMRFVWDLKHRGVRQVGKLFLPRVFGIDISQISLLVGSIIGTTLAAGSVSLFNLSMNIAIVPVGIIAIPFAIAAFPTMSNAAALEKHEEFISAFASTFRQIMFFLIPFAALAIILRVHIIRVIIGTSNLSWEDTLLASASFAIFVFSLLFQGLTPLLARTFYALKNTVIPVIIAAISMIVNVGAVYGFLHWLERGNAAEAFVRSIFAIPGTEDLRVLSLALGFTLASTVQVALLLIMLSRRFGNIGGRGIFLSFMKFLAGAVASVIAAVFALRGAVAITDSSTFIGIFLQAALATIAGFGVYGLVLWLTRSEEFMALHGALKKNLLKLREPFAINETQEL